MSQEQSCDLLYNTAHLFIDLPDTQQTASCQEAKLLNVDIINNHIHLMFHKAHPPAGSDNMKGTRKAPKPQEIKTHSGGQDKREEERFSSDCTASCIPSIPVEAAVLKTHFLFLIIPCFFMMEFKDFCAKSDIFIFSVTLPPAR